MMFPNNNRAIINKLSRRALANNKIRNIMLVLAIVLTTTLFTSLFTIGMGMVETIEQNTMRQAGGTAHATLKYLTEEEFAVIKDHPLIERLGYRVLVGMAENEELLKRNTEIYYGTEDEAKMSFSYPTQGRMPERENELATDTVILDLLGTPHEIGQRVLVETSIYGKKVAQEFILSGFWEGDAVTQYSRMYVAKPFSDNVLANIAPGEQKHDMGSSLIFADIMFEDSWNIEKDIQTVISDSGYSIEENSPKQISYGVNWSYMSTNFQVDVASMAIVLGGTLLIIFTGYLIIYNIFQIAVTQDIRYYGLLKTIGMTSTQIQKLILRQAFLLSILGIPLGLLIGFLLGMVLLPIIMSISTLENSYISFSPLIFIGAAVFSLLTVWIGSRKPGKIAGSISPVEAVRYTEQGVPNQKLSKNSVGGGKIYKMAFANLARNKKKTVIVIISMSLSLILLNSVYTLTTGFDMNKYLSKFVTTDFVIGHANYFNNRGFHTENDVVSGRFIEVVEAQEGIEGSGKIFYNIRGSSLIHNNEEQGLQLYGLEEFPLSQLNMVEGEMDLEKLKTGNYIIDGVQSDDNGKVIWGSSSTEIGDIVTVEMSDGITKEYEVLAKAEISRGLSVRYSYRDGAVMYLPGVEFFELIDNPVTMSYILNVDEKHSEAMEKFLQEYTTKVEQTMDYESKERFVREFKTLQDMFLTVGGILSLIIGLIGILNIINVILTSIISRSREFAMLQSIGMTDRQLSRMLMLEGLFYALWTIVISVTVGTLFSFIVIRSIAGKLWFFSYDFVILPLLLTSPLLVLFSLLIPFASYRGTSKLSIVERLREVQ